MCVEDEGSAEGFAFIDLACQRCATQMQPTPLPSGMVVLRCPTCRLVTI